MSDQNQGGRIENVDLFDFFKNVKSGNVPEFLCLCRESASRNAWSTACSSSSSSSPSSFGGDVLVGSSGDEDVSFSAGGDSVADLRR